jgi:hypothetical protein
MCPAIKKQIELLEIMQQKQASLPNLRSDSSLLIALAKTCATSRAAATSTSLSQAAAVLPAPPSLAPSCLLSPKHACGNWPFDSQDETSTVRKFDYCLPGADGRDYSIPPYKRPLIRGGSFQVTSLVGDGLQVL